MQLVAGIQSLNLPERFAKAKNRIILHAAVYGPFAESAPHRDGLAQALNKPSFRQLDIIAMSCDPGWAGPFMKALRFGANKETYDRTLNASTKFLRELQAAHTDKVRIHPQTTIPCMPLVIIDDTIIFGQYAHCEEYAATGIWGTMEADVETLFQWASTSLPDNTSDEERAAYRMISECHHAMTGGAR